MHIENFINLENMYINYNNLLFFLLKKKNLNF